MKRARYLTYYAACAILQISEIMRLYIYDANMRMII